MQRPSSAGEAQQQAARRSLVLRIAFNDLRSGARLADFLLAEVPLHHPSKGVPAEIELSGGQFLLDLQQRFHFAALPGRAEVCTEADSTILISSGVRPPACRRPGAGRLRA